MNFFSVLKHSTAFILQLELGKGIFLSNFFFAYLTYTIIGYEEKRIIKFDLLEELRKAEKRLRICTPVLVLSRFAIIT